MKAKQSGRIEIHWNWKEQARAKITEEEPICYYIFSHLRSSRGLLQQGFRSKQLLSWFTEFRPERYRNELDTLLCTCCYTANVLFTPLCPSLGSSSNTQWVMRLALSSLFRAWRKALQRLRRHSTHTTSSCAFLISRWVCMRSGRWEKLLLEQRLRRAALMGAAVVGKKRSLLACYGSSTSLCSFDV